MKKVLVFFLLASFTFSLFTINNSGLADTVKGSKLSYLGNQNEINSNSGTKTNILVYQSSFSQIPKFKTLSNSNNSWQELGPRNLLNPNNAQSWGQAPYSGRVAALAINQSNPNIIYLGSAQGGVWKTDDGGQTWVPLMDNQSNMAIGSMAMSSDGKMLLVGTGEANHAIDSYYGRGILKSTNEGQTWQTIGADVFNSSAISGIVINATNSSWIVASTTWASSATGLNWGWNSHNIGIFISKDGGQTWSNTSINGVPSQTYIGASQLLADPVNNSILFASGYRGEIWESTDSGQTWSLSSFTSPFSNATRVAIGMSANDPDMLIAAFANSGYNLGGIYSFNITSHAISSLGTVPSAKWAPCNGQCWYNLILSVDPTNASIMYFGGTDLYRSLDGGLSWSIIGGYNSGSVIHPDQHALEFYPGSPSEIIVGDDGGVYSSKDTGNTWVNLNNNLRTIQFNTVAASPTDDTFLIGGAQDNGCENYNNNTSWSVAHTGDGGSAIFYDNKTIICNYSGLYVEKSTDGGVIWSNAYSGINTSDYSLFYPPMAQDPSNKSTIYLGSDHFYKSTNFASSWTDLGLVSTGDISAISVAPSNESIIYIGDDTGIVQVSKDGGTTWNQILNTTSKYGSWIPISHIAIDPLNASNIYVSLGSRYSPRLLFSHDMGATWNVISNLGQIPNDVAINTIKINPVTKILFLGTDRGIYYFNGTTFNALGSGLPNSAVYDFAFTHSNYLVVATHGRGMWLNYMTPDITLFGPASNSIITSSTTVTITIKDPNGVNQSLYNWDNSVNNTLISGTSLIIPTSVGQHNLKVYSQDVTGNWVSQSYYYYIPSSATSTTTTTAPISSTVPSTTTNSSNTSTTSNISTTSSTSLIPTSIQSKKTKPLPGFEFLSTLIIFSLITLVYIKRRK